MSDVKILPGGFFSGYPLFRAFSSNLLQCSVAKMMDAMCDMVIKCLVACARDPVTFVAAVNQKKATGPLGVRARNYIIDNIL